MTYNSAIHNRRSMRLQGFDYASERCYFLTLNTKNRLHLFGEIRNGVMVLNDSGKIAKECWLKIPFHFPHAKIHEFVIMPDHIHGIIELIENKGNGRVGRFESPEKTIGSVVRGFKIGVTKWVRANTDLHEVWQRNYYDHIIRERSSFERISAYIEDNPKNWTH